MKAEWHRQDGKKFCALQSPGMAEVAYGRGMKANSRVSETIL